MTLRVGDTEYKGPKSKSDDSLALPLGVGLGGGIGVLALIVLAVFLVKRSKKNKHDGGSKKVYVKDAESGAAAH
jgi:hypothetical protein